MSKKETYTPPIIQSREAMESVVADVVRLKLERAAMQASLESQIAALTKKHEASILTADKQIEIKEAGVYLYCTQHRNAIFGDKKSDTKSIETMLATVGFELTPHSVEKVRTKDTWPVIAKRLLGLVFYHPEDANLQRENRRVLLNCADYVREADPEVDKNALKRDRDKLTREQKEQLEVAGIRIVQDEIFFIRPKSQVAEPTTVAA